MKTIDLNELPYEIEKKENVWIQMRDGTHLSANIWLPIDAHNRPVPAVLEYIPYRKNDVRRGYDQQIHAYFAGHGYASIRVDIRGSGESEGILTDEYLPQELDDGEDILQWLDDQEWCTGRVGMIGISWGGFNGLQIAARKTKQLQAVVSICSTDDRYADDIHYMGGALLGQNLSWASTMFAYNSLPPDPNVVGNSWKEMWFDRLENSGLWIEKWMRQLHRNDYWKHGSICENFDDVDCAIMAVSGWADGYSNSVFRLMEHLKGPKKALVGPWSHKYPHEGVPGPAIGFLQECVRWWDQWLKDEETGIMDEPMVQSYMQESYDPKTKHTEIPGRWIGENEWPSKQVKPKTYHITSKKLISTTQENQDTDFDPVTIESPLNVGLYGGKWYSSGGAPDLPYDQRLEDGGSLCFETDPLDERLEIHGAPIIDLEVSSNKSQAMIAVRLSDISPDQKATRVTYGMLNLSHRHSHEFPEPLQPGKKERINVKLNDIAHSFKPGHRVRLSFSTVYWPVAWPSPESVALTVYPNNSEVLLPVREANKKLDESVTKFKTPEVAKGIDSYSVNKPDQNWFINHDLGKETTTLHTVNDAGKKFLPEINLNFMAKTQEWYQYKGNDFESVSGEVNAIREVSRDDWKVYTETNTVLTCDKDNFYINATLDAYEHDQRVFSKTWNETIKRQLL